jgi:hypothetical protein
LTLFYNKREKRFEDEEGKKDVDVTENPIFSLSLFLPLSFSLSLSLSLFLLISI